MQAEQIFYLKSQNEKTQSDLEDIQVTTILNKEKSNQ